MTKHSSINFYERQKRGILMNGQNLWSEKVIPYFVHPKLDPTLIKVAFQRISRETCLFFPRQKHYNESLFVFLPGNHYETNLGKKNEIPHKIFIPLSLIDIGKTTREILRALGIEYEHNRIDRDHYVTINYRNINHEFRKYFIKDFQRFTVNYGSSYDYRSIMHFQANEYSKNHRKTIRAQNTFMEPLMGKSQYPSFYDIKLLNKKYCTFRSIAHPECFLNGYQHPRTPHICKCLPFTFGDQCENIIHQHQHCTGNNFFFVTRSPRRNTTQVGGRCVFFFRARERKRILLILKFNVPNNRRHRECNEKNSIEIKTASDIAVGGVLFCPNGKTLKFISPFNMVTIISNFFPPTNLQLNITYVHC